MRTHLCLLIATITLLAAHAPHAAAQQGLQGPWVDAGEQRIAQHRKTDVRIIVLNAAGEPVPGAAVHIDQQRHDFPLGFTLTDETWPRAIAGSDPLWRTFNAVSLDRLTDWSAMSPQRDAPPKLEAIERVTRQAQRAGVKVRFGGVMSADLARNPAWLIELDPPAQQRAWQDRLHQALLATPGRFDQFDLYTHALDHQHIEQRFGQAALRTLYEQAHALAPEAAIGLRVRDCLLGGRMNDMAQRIVAMQHAFIPCDYLAIEQRMSQQLVQAPLQRTFDWLEGVNVDVVLVGLEVGGASEAAAAYNLEVLLRTAFASPAVRGIWFGPLTGEHATAERAALLGSDGEPTPAGRVVDRLFHQTWRTDERAATDALGNVRAAIFAGVHRITANLPDGRTRAMTVHVPRSDTERVIVLEADEP